MDSNDRTTVEAMLSEQRREILNAKSVNADLDYAFDLQLQEAITVSMNHLPSSSLSSPPTPLADAGGNGEFEIDYMTLLLEDIKQVEQEFEDRRQSEVLLREMKEDLDRRISDQQFADEILKIPDLQWEKYGDNYEKPYVSDGTGGQCSTSSSSVAAQLAWVSSETFRLYFKGLESEERVRDKTVAVAGFGVAICDSRDNLIFDLSKGFDAAAVVGREIGKVAEGLVVAIHALIEGLNAALTFDLKKITYMCDDFMAYQYVTGRVQPAQREILDLLNQVFSIQKKFTECRPSLVARNDIKFAFKLARDAIVSQITWCVEDGKGKNLKETCVICYEDTDSTQMFAVDNCLHRYCFSCMKQHVEVTLLNGKDAKCPHVGCESEIKILSCEKFLDPKVVNIMSQRKKEASIPVTDKIYCPYPKCSNLMTKREVLAYTKHYFVGAEASGARRCMKCRNYFCINCRVAWHYDMNCYDYKQSNRHAREDKMLNSLANHSKWRQCVKCSHMIELADGCYHITCRCGYEFCYTCGAPWKNKKATCSCAIWDERNLIHERGPH
ncbi:E3 ubiquitin-protein ligase RSL1 [Linum grandiflorum]